MAGHTRHPSVRVSHDYDAFVSYNHGADKEATAPGLQRLIRRVGRPWFRPGILRVYRDRTNSPMSEDLWESIEHALVRSRYFILLASPEAAKSPWVIREVEYWRRNRERSTFLIVRTGGDIVWTGDDFDWEHTDALPDVLAGWFTNAPTWGDVATDGLRDVARTIAAQLYGIDKDQIDGEDERETRRARRTLRGGVVALALLTVLAVVAAVVAFVQLGEARTQARISLSRQLAAVSSSELATNVDTANLLAVQAFRTDPNPQTRAALFRAVTASEHLVRYLPFAAPVTELAGSADGNTVIVGLQDGRVFRWRQEHREPELLLRLRGAVNGLAVSGDGNTVVASDEATVRLVRPGQAPTPVQIPAGWRAEAVDVSLSGRTVILSTAEDRFEGDSTVSVITVGDGTVSRVDHDLGTEYSMPPSAVATSDEDVLLLDGAYGQWERRRLADWSPLARSSAGFGTKNYGVTTAADGGSFSYTNGSTTISVWPTDRPTDIDHPPTIGHAPITTPQALTLNADGSRLAVTEAGVIHVSPVQPVGEAPASIIKLSGTGRINEDGLRFLGQDGSKLISASGSKVTLWDLDQTDRMGKGFPIELSYGCSACGPPHVTVSPDGWRIVAVDGSGWSGVAGPLDRPAEVRALPDPGLSALYGPVLWEADGRHATLLVQPPAGGSEAPVPGGMPEFLRARPAGERAGGVLATGFTSDATRVIVVQLDGGIDLLDPTSGATRTVTPDPNAPPSPKAPQVQAAAVSSTADLVAVADDTHVTVRDALNGTVVGRTRRDDVLHLAFTSDQLLMQRNSGELEIWDERATGIRRVIGGDAAYFSPPAVTPNGTLVARAREDGSIALHDLRTGSQLATFAASSPGHRVGIGFSADGAQLVTVTEGDDVTDTVLVYRDISEEQLVRMACDVAGRDLTVGEWQALIGGEAPGDLRCQ